VQKEHSEPEQNKTIGTQTSIGAPTSKHRVQFACMCCSDVHSVALFVHNCMKIVDAAVAAVAAVAAARQQPR
jgi:hypothetical protein